MLKIDTGGFRDRENFGKMLNELRLLETAVEVGTHRGEFAGSFLSKWWGKKLYGVDHWRNDYNDRDPASRGNRQDDYRQAAKVAERNAPRLELIIASSQEASAQFIDGSLDFVYIDADHEYVSVLSDLCLWWPKLKPGGILAGHDIVCPGEPQNACWSKPVQDAVFKFASGVVHNNIHRTIYLVAETLSWPWSFYLIK